MIDGMPVGRLSALRTALPLPLWERSMATLHGHVHHGYQSLVRRSGEFEVPSGEVATMLEFSTSLALHTSLNFTELVSRTLVAEKGAGLAWALTVLQGEIAAFLRALDLATVK